MIVIGFTVASRNNDRTVGGKVFAWRRRQDPFSHAESASGRKGSDSP